MDIKQLVAQMTIEEKALLCSGKNFWETRNIDRLNIPSITLSDGPYGVVKRGNGFSGAIPATCFPTSCAMASSWDINLIYSVGEAIGKECKAEGVGILLGPGLNIQRSPLGGRNFEYYSEDPVLSGEIGTAFVKGVQSQGVGACAKHFVANNQEYHRTKINNIIDERTLNEIYLANFERVIKLAKPYVVMAAYNKLNCIHCTENKYLLTDVLRKQWNFDGFVISDWYAVNSIVDSLKVGLDLEMPYSQGVNTNKLIEAVYNGVLDEEVINSAVESILNIVFRVKENKKIYTTYNKIEHNDLARVAAGNCIVLLKNEGNILPLKRSKTKKRKIAVIGEYAKSPRIQGGGSAHVTPTMVEIPYDEILKLSGNHLKVLYAQGYNSLDENDDSFINDARKVARDSDIVILFVGLPESYDESGHDRITMDLPKNQVKLIEEISSIQKDVIVILNNGSTVTIAPWHNCVKGIIEGWLCGQGFGGAIADILFGIINPSGKMSSTFPVQLSDNPTYLDYVGPDNNLLYEEGILVGYRYYDKKNIDVQFPFGYGLSYTTFQYSNLKLSSNRIKEKEILEVSLKVKNTGRCFGKEVIQLYVSDVESSVPRPIKELKAFVKVGLDSGEERTVNFNLNKRDFAFYDISTKNWAIESGMFKILIGKSSRDICLIGDVFVESSYKPKIVYNNETFIGDFLANPRSGKLVKSLLEKYIDQIDEDTEQQALMNTFIKQFPIRLLLILSSGELTENDLEKIIELSN